MSLLDVVPWGFGTAELADPCAKLELVSPYGTVPVVCLSLDDENWLLAVPSEYTPWLPASLIPLADPETGAASADGMCTGVSFVGTFDWSRHSSSRVVVRAGTC
jgi:hypothetical protein